MKIASGVQVVQRVHKAPGGLMRAAVEVTDGALHNVSLSGDFFCYPREGIIELERRLTGVPIREAPAAIREFYDSEQIESPGVTPEDWVAAITGGYIAPVARDLVAVVEQLRKAK